MIRLFKVNGATDSLYVGHYTFDLAICNDFRSFVVMLCMAKDVGCH